MSTHTIASPDLAPDLFDESSAPTSERAPEVSPLAYSVRPGDLSARRTLDALER